jgi:hypothetical protein
MKSVLKTTNLARLKQMPTQGALTIGEQQNLKDKMLTEMINWNQHYNLQITCDEMWDLIPDLIKVVGTEVRLETLEEYEGY